MNPIYLDHNATTPLDPRVAEAMDRCQAEAWGNPSSQHRAGRQARQRLEDARESLAGLLGAELSGPAADRLLLTSGGTEANNLAVLGLAEAARQRHGAPGRVVVSAVEHSSVLAPAEHLAAEGWDLVRLEVNAAGVVRLAQLRELLAPPTRLACVMYVNNETGVLQPVEEAAALCRAAGVPLHVDGVQAVGKVPVDFRRLGAASLAASAHKFHGPRGSGLLLVRGDAPLAPRLYGGAQQSALRPGTESVAAAVGLARALELWHDEAPQRQARWTQLRDRFEAALCAALDNVVVHGRDAPRLPHSSNLSFLGADRQALLMALDLAGVACSSGSACASGSSEPSPVLLAMGCPEAAVASALRFSLGACTTLAEVEQAAQRIINVVNNLRNQNPLRNSPPPSRQPPVKRL